MKATLNTPTRPVFSPLDNRPMRLSLVLAAILLTMGCAPVAKSPGPSGASAGTGATPWGVNTSFIAKDIPPGDDFYQFVNHGYVTTAKIPPGKPLAGTFVDLELKTDEQVKAIVRDVLAKPGDPGTASRQIADFYTSFMDMPRRESRGIEMLMGQVTKMLAAKDRAAVARQLGAIASGPFFKLGPTIDQGRPERYSLATEQAGLGLPGREYYLNVEEPYRGHRDAYARYIQGVFSRAGIADGQRKAEAILAFETALARVHWTPEQTRDAVKNYHPMTPAALARYAPGFDWRGFLSASGYPTADTIQVGTDTAIKGQAALFAKAPLDTLRAYTAFHYLNNHADLLSKAWSDARFDLFSRRLLGIAEQRPLDEQAVEQVNGYLWEPVGKLYVERYFPAESKARIEELVAFIREALRERLLKNDWMDETTRREALTKLDSFRAKIGYPDRWRDYSSVNISPQDLVGNVHAIAEWQRADDQAKLKAPRRAWEWSNKPQEINASYVPDRNEITFPAGILQPPFFDPQADPAVNYGAIGVVIGHEVGHGFDDQGSQYDGTGKLRNWWLPESRKRFEGRAKLLVSQFDAYSPLPGLNVNGRLTLGENIGDLAGLTLSHAAYHKYLAAKFPNGAAPVLDGYSGDQRFFLGFAQLWRMVVSDAFLRQWTLTDAHTPNNFRVNGALRNFDPWYEAFQVKPEHKLYLPKAERAAIW